MWIINKKIGQIQKSLPDPLNDSGGRLQGRKIRIVDNFGEVIYTCNNIAGRSKNNISHVTWHEVLENPIIRKHDWHLRNLPTKFFPCLPSRTDHLLIIVVRIIFCKQIIKDCVGDYKLNFLDNSYSDDRMILINTCQLGFSPPSISLLQLRVDHGCRGSPC